MRTRFCAQIKGLKGLSFEDPALEKEYRDECRHAAVRVGYLFSFLASFHSAYFRSWNMLLWTGVFRV